MSTSKSSRFETVSKIYRRLVLSISSSKNDFVLLLIFSAVNTRTSSGEFTSENIAKMSVIFVSFFISCERGSIFKKESTVNLINRSCRFPFALTFSAVYDFVMNPFDSSGRLMFDGLM